jgi:hypothetical protein
MENYDTRHRFWYFVGSIKPRFLVNLGVRVFAAHIQSNPGSRPTEGSVWVVTTSLTPQGLREIA